MSSHTTWDQTRSYMKVWEDFDLMRKQRLALNGHIKRTKPERIATRSSPSKRREKHKCLGSMKFINTYKNVILDDNFGNRKIYRIQIAELWNWWEEKYRTKRMFIFSSWSMSKSEPENDEVKWKRKEPK